MSKPFTPSDIHPCLAYDDAPAAIAWLCHAFGFTKRFVVEGENSRIEHSELSLGSGVIMVSSPKPATQWAGPKQIQGGMCAALSVYVENPDTHFERALAAGARIIQPLRDEDYGARGYLAEDLEGHRWYFGNYRPGAYWTE